MIARTRLNITLNVHCLSYFCVLYTSLLFASLFALTTSKDIRLPDKELTESSSDVSKW